MCVINACLIALAETYLETCEMFACHYFSYDLKITFKCKLNFNIYPINQFSTLHLNIIKEDNITKKLELN